MAVNGWDAIFRLPEPTSDQPTNQSNQPTKPSQQSKRQYQNVRTIESVAKEKPKNTSNIFKLSQNVIGIADKLTAFKSNRCYRIQRETANRLPAQKTHGNQQMYRKPDQVLNGICSTSCM